MRQADGGGATTGKTLDLGAGIKDFERIWYENAGNTSVSFSINGALAPAAPAPVPQPVAQPAARPLMLPGLGARGFAARRRQSIPPPLCKYP